MRQEKSKTYFKEAQDLLVGGVNSPVRAFGSVGGSPIFIKKAKGSKIVDEDLNSYIDMVSSWGPLILGHAHPGVVKSIQEAAKKGTSFGAPTLQETLFIKEIQKSYPSMQKIRLVNSGTEATQSAIRLARGVTARELIVKFEGCYHGHTDGLLVKAGSGGATFGIPTSAGISKKVGESTMVLPYNEENVLERLFKSRGKQIACVIVEPIAANMGVVLPKPGFLKTLRTLCTQYKVVLIFDEIITGYRVSKGGAQKLYNVTPDITCLGKIIGGGLPIGAYGGKKEMMSLLSPMGPVYQAGTLSGNPIAVAAGLTTLKELSKKGTYEALFEKTKYFCANLKKILDKSKIRTELNWTCGMFTLFFTHMPITDFKSANKLDSKKYAAYFHFMLNKGVYLPPSAFEANMISLAHSKKDLDAVLTHMTEYFL